MTDAERLLRILLHDLRTPIGVAQGYLRMMQEGSPTDPAEQARRIGKALKALGQTTRLCQSATDFLDAAAGPMGVTGVPVSSLAQQVELTARSQTLDVSTGRIHAGATLALAGDVAKLSEAIVLVLLTAGGQRRTIHIEADEDELSFVATDLLPSSIPPGAPFDGWSVGLPVAVACRRISWSSGRILKFETGSGAIVAFPLKAKTERDETA